VQVAIALLGLTALSAFVIDYGVLWVARRQAQNSADAAAMAGAISMGFVAMNNQPLARQAAIDAATANRVWGQPPSITNGDVTFPACPPGSPGAGSNACIQVDLFRNQARGNPLPVFFGRVANVTNQGVQATATAEVLFGESTTCVKPWAIPDKWVEAGGTWDENDVFERYYTTGNRRGRLLPNPDYYEPPNAPGGSYRPNGTGFTRDSVTLGGSDYGRQITLHFAAGNGQDHVGPGWYQAVQLGCGPGARCYSDAISGCDPMEVGPGTLLQTQQGAHVGPTTSGMQELYDQDPNARWVQSLNGGRGGIQGGCMAAGTCTISPRLVAVPVYNPDAYQFSVSQPGNNRTIQIVKVIGFFLERAQSGGEVVGHIMAYPSAPRGGTSTTPDTAFVISVALVR